MDAVPRSSKNFFSSTSASSRRPVRRGVLCLIVAAAAAVTASAAEQSVTLAWNPNPETNLSGYRLYVGTASRVYSQNSFVPVPTTIHTVTNLSSGSTYYFAVTALATDGLESDYSDEVSYLVPSPPPPAPQSPVITWAPPVPIVYGASLGFAQLNATANIPGSFAYFPPAGTILGASAGQTLTAIFTPYDLLNFTKTTNYVSLAIQPASLTVLADPKSKVYGAPTPPLTASYIGFVNGDTPASLDTPTSLSTSATGASSVGAYPISVGGAVDANYTITRLNGTMTVTRAGLIVFADDKSRPYGQANPPLTASYLGFVNGDTMGNLDQPVVLTTLATPGSPAGTYPIVASAAADANYSITLQNGTLTIEPRFQAFVNFQPATAEVPGGYVKDDGAVYASRGNGFIYGWNAANTSAAYERESTRSPDQRYDTLHLMQKPGAGSVWEIAVPPGTYSVTVVAGDATRHDSEFRVNVEGVLTVNGNPSPLRRWLSGTSVVTVSDGRLTLSNGTGAINNKICFVDIAAEPGMALAGRPGNEPLRIRDLYLESPELRVMTLENAFHPHYIVEFSSDLATWNVLGVVPRVDNELVFDHPETELPPPSMRYYRIRNAP
jgi:hypothetical protein